MTSDTETGAAGAASGRRAGFRRVYSRTVFASSHGRPSSPTVIRFKIDAFRLFLIALSLRPGIT
jgi:hypothetical protein